MDDRFCRMLREAVIDEREAVGMYRELAALAPTERARRIFLQYSRDEARHYRTDRAIYRRHCPNQPLS